MPDQFDQFETGIVFENPVNHAGFEALAAASKLTIWPACTECHAAWCLQRRYSMSAGWLWLWGPECKCGKRKRPAPALPQFADGFGPLETDDRGGE